MGQDPPSTTSWRVRIYPPRTSACARLRGQSTQRWRARRRTVSAPSTINTIVVLDALAPPAALVNLVITVTEVKTSVLRDAAIRGPDGRPATGTSTDAVVIAATGRGRAREFGGPISDLGAVTARAARRALERGVAAWLERHR